MQNPSIRLIISILLHRVADLEYVIYILNRVGYVKWIYSFYFYITYYFILLTWTIKLTKFDYELSFLPCFFPAPLFFQCNRSWPTFAAVFPPSPSLSLSRFLSAHIRSAYLLNKFAF